MVSNIDDDKKKTLSLAGKKLELKKTGDAEQIRQSFSHGRSKTVEVEVKRKRSIDKPNDAKLGLQDTMKTAAELGLTSAELESRIRLLQEAREREAIEQVKRDEELKRQLADKLQQVEAQKIAEAQANEQLAADEPEIDISTDAPAVVQDPEQFEQVVAEPTSTSIRGATHKKVASFQSNTDEGASSRGRNSAERTETRKPMSGQKREGDFKGNIHRMVSNPEDTDERGLSRYRRFKKTPKRKIDTGDDAKKMVREVIIPEVVTVQELSNRMAVRAADVVKKLMSMGVMATINQPIDADTAAIVVIEFGHIPKKVSMSDVELGLGELTHDQDDLMYRAPIVTVMGHVDHGKTSLLDAIRASDVASREAGGITQHIGAYQVTLPSQQKITFIDTPGHAAFSEMRARGANVTDVVVLVVAADDGIMAQTIEAISHAKAANVPIIVAINKMDKPDADAARVRSELLSHNIVLEDFGGDVMSVEVSAKKKLNIDKLLDTILLQAEVLDLKANPNRAAVGMVVEARMERGRGAVATILIQQGTLKIGDIFVAGAEWGRVRALVNDHGQVLKQVLPAMPVEVLGFNGPPSPGDQFVVVETESRAREVAEFRLHRTKELKASLVRNSTIDQLILRKVENNLSELSIIIKSDVQGSVEAIVSSLGKLATTEVAVKVLYAGVGGINESDVTLANASKALVVGFNVRANPQAREAASRDGIEIRYYSIIYDVINDVKDLLSGMLAPTLKENFLGNASIREVFNITKTGKIAGCMITEGVVKRGARVRLLRDNIVIHEGTLKTLKRFKDEVKEVKEGYECGMAFEGYQDIRAGDIIECFEIQSIAREL